ncbi:MAG: ABC transporter ATP-binding protein [Eubacteriales bacterium]|nr:ABC transporter ATP-binding protein [Eubacteriales bacterium]
MLKLLRYLKPYRWGALGTLLLVLLQCLTDLKLPDIMSGIVDRGIALGDTPYILSQGGGMLLVALLGMLCAVGSGFLSARISSAVARDLRLAVFAKIESFSLDEFDRFGAASLITRNTNDIQQIQMVVLMALRFIMMAPVMFVGGIIMALGINVQLTAVLAGAIPVILVGVVLIGGRATHIFKSMQAKLDRLNLVVREGQTGVRVIRAFNRIPFQNQRFDDANEALAAAGIRANRLVALMQPLMMLVMNFTTIAIIWFASRMIGAGSLQVGGMMAFIQYAMQILFSLLMVAMIFIMLPRATASAERINEVLDVEPGIRDSGTALPDEGVRAQVEFKDVSFHYQDAEEPALRGIHFTARRGQTTAVIGGTGAGKTTLLNLIPRFYDVSDGQVLVDGVDVRAMEQQKLRARIAYVPQKAVLFSGTVADNLRYGKADADDDDIARALDTAQATDFVLAMDGGADAGIAQGGTNVSGGQKQRLAIARALIRNPEIYLFDDSFSALDFRTDAQLRRALKERTGDAAVLIVAQRISTILDADQILVLDEGRQVGLGTHRELMQTCSIYREIAESQLSKEELA